MKQVVMENPVINSAFEEPTRHFRFTDEGITNEIAESRRKSAYFIPIAAPKKKTKQPQPLPESRNKKNILLIHEVHHRYRHQIEGEVVGAIQESPLKGDERGEAKKYIVEIVKTGVRIL